MLFVVEGFFVHHLQFFFEQLFLIMTLEASVGFHRCVGFHVIEAYHVSERQPRHLISKPGMAFDAGCLAVGGFLP